MANGKRKVTKDKALRSLIGKTIARVEEGTVEGPFGDEPCIFLIFTDGTEHGFVLPTDISD